MNADDELLKNLDKLHTTELGVERIKRNLFLDTDDVVGWCKAKIDSVKAVITRSGKNWYVNIDNCIIKENRLIKYLLLHFRIQDSINAVPDFKISIMMTGRAGYLFHMMF